MFISCTYASRNSPCVLIHIMLLNILLAPSVPVSNVRGFAPDHSSIILEWDPPPTLLTNGIITAYIIKVIERETGLRFEHNTTTTSITLDSLHPHYIYECRIAARTVETGPFSTVFAVQVLMAGKSMYTIQCQTPITIKTIN